MDTITAMVDMANMAVMDIMGKKASMETNMEAMGLTDHMEDTEDTGIVTMVTRMILRSNANAFD